ncbi:MAG: hypothetical protein VKL59_15725 [Nostocaceae cyanobacterium]|nr:hypothetical protein [Nostocaceae cyanobacterium]
MNWEPETTTSTTRKTIEFAPPASRNPLVLLRDTEALLRKPTVATLTPILPAKLSNNLQQASSVADESLNELAEIDLEEISDWELRPARIRIGLSFVGFGALMIVLLLLYLKTLHPELSPVQQIQAYWYQYIWFVCFGVAGMFILGREAMRSGSQ